MLRAYIQLRDRVDRFISSVTDRYREQIVCAPGCATCCCGGLTLTMVEAVSLGEGLGLNADRVFLQAGQEPLETDDTCRFLGEDQRCMVYSHRPLVCRTQGIPLKHREVDGISVCELNFVDVSPHESAVLDMDNLETALFAANLDFCRRAGIHPLSRVAMDRLADMATVKGDSQE